MSGPQLIYASLLLGAFVLLGGGYGVLHTIAHLRHAPGWLRGAHACYALQWLTTLALVASTPLGIGWKLLIVASCLATIAIPQVTWKYLERTHAHEHQ
jgi:hypothetical protein